MPNAFCGATYDHGSFPVINSADNNRSVHNVVDFVCLEKRLVIELNAGHHADDIQLEYDSERTAWLEQNGYRVIRFWNHDVRQSAEAVKQAIFQALQ